jgi:hypothetical protein
MPRNVVAHRRPRRLLGVALTALSTMALMAWPAAAQSTADLAAKMQALQNQILSMQRQLDQLKAAQTKAAADAAQAQAAAAAQARATAAAQAQAKAAADESARLAASSQDSFFKRHKIKITPGGFAAAESIFRSRNETSDMASSFNTGIPFPNSHNYYVNEFRGSARQSRLSLLAQGSVDESTDLAAYFEGDFLGAAPTANSLESNSYNPRIRQIYLTTDLNNLGLHFLAGQAWSMLTLNKTGIVPRQEDIPLTIDAQYVVGFDWTRNWQLRAVKDFDNGIHAGISLESPQANVFLGPNPPLVTTTTTNPGGSQLNQFANYSLDIAPDVIGKLAWDPGWGHYEAFGVGRFFRDRADGFNNVIIGGAGGLSAILPLFPKKLDLEGTVMYGQGIGRYGSAQLPDVTIDAFGNLHAIPEVTARLGLIGHPTPRWDLYGYAGIEQAQKTASTTGGLGFGYGSELYNNSGCLIEGSTVCAQNTSQVWQVAAGAWYRLFQGDFGTLALGAQASYTHRDIFDGIGGAPNTDDTMFFTSIRYYPFQ